MEQIPVAPEGRLGLWAIEEPEEILLAGLGLSPAEQTQLSTLKGPKRLEYLCARALVHALSGLRERVPLEKNFFGKPFLPGSPWGVSISHSYGFAAALLAPGDIGIDVQRLTDKIGRIAHKFLGDTEQQSLDNTHLIEHLHVFWGAKEAIYKAYGKKALDFRTHIRVAPFAYSRSGGNFTGQLDREGLTMDFQLQYCLRGEYMLVWAVPGREASFERDAK